MAGKKKKKPAANPARGFATTSVPSKPKAASDVDEQSLQATQHQTPNSSDDERANDAVILPDKQASTEKNVVDMTPEELEQHLEQSELQYLVETHATRVKSDAARQVARLENEKRQLRQLADRISISELNEQLMEEILPSASPSLVAVTAANHSNVTKLTIDEDDLLLKLWALREVLMRLQMPSIDQALSHVLTILQTGITFPADDYLPGLGASFMWYARTQNPADLPDHETGKVKNAGTDEEWMNDLQPGE